MSAIEPVPLYGKTSLRIKTAKQLNENAIEWHTEFLLFITEIKLQKQKSGCITQPLFQNSIVSKVFIF